MTCLKDTGARNFLSITLFLQRVSSKKNVRGVKKINGVPNFFVPKRSVPNGVCLTEKNIVFLARLNFIGIRKKNRIFAPFVAFRRKLAPAPSPART